MRPFIVTALEAGKLPRWALLLLCVLYALPGFVGRDPWRTQDAAGFGIALTMARGTSADWLMPNIAGQPVAEEGPLPFWLGALAARALSALATEHAAMRLAAIAWLLGAFALMWYGAWMLARRPGVQPSDPFGASASRTDFGRAIADSALLVAMASIGLIARVHETTAEAAQVAWVALFMFGAAHALEHPRRGGAIAGLAVAATLLSRGLPLAASMGLALAALPLASHAWRLVARPMLSFAAGAFLLCALPWPLALAAGDAAQAAWLADWLRWNAQQASGPTLRSVGYALRTIPWFFWPAWPVALWAAWRWRGRWDEPAVALPLLMLAAFALHALASPDGSEALLLPAILPLAMLAAMGLPTVRRGIVSLLDWIAVATFSLVGLAIWAYWIALMTGFPPRMAFSASRLAPGFEPTWIAVDLALGLLATVAWLLLVQWRVSRQPRMIWRPMVLSCGGLALAWFLLSTLWMQVFNERNTYRDVGQALARELPAGYGCVQARELGPAQRATFYYFGNLRFAREGERCGWLLVQDRGPIARAVPNDEPGWKPVWQGRRRSDPDERFRLYRRAGS